MLLRTDSDLEEDYCSENSIRRGGTAGSLGHSLKEIKTPLSFAWAFSVVKTLSRGDISSGARSSLLDVCQGRNAFYVSSLLHRAARHNGLVKRSSAVGKRECKQVVNAGTIAGVHPACWVMFHEQLLGCEW